MHKLAIIDIGSNSIRLVLIKIQNNSYKFIDDLKETVRLEQGIDPFGYINEEKIEETVRCISSFEELCRAHQTNHIIAVATAAVRKAKNQNMLLGKIKKETGIDVKVISGSEEAMYGFKGVICSMDIYDGITIDIGGGSTEIIQIKNGMPADKLSLPFGSIDLCRQFSLKSILDHNTEKRLFSYLKSHFEKIEWLSEAKKLNVIGIGGVIRNIGKIDRKMKNYPFELVHSYEVSFNDIDHIFNRVKKNDYNNRKKIKGLSADRADIFVGACAIIIALMRYIQSDKMIISGNGLREGLLFEFLENKNIMKFDNSLSASLKNIISNMSVNEKHSENVYSIFKTLYQKLLTVHGIKDSLSIHKIIKTSSYLHDCGMLLRYYHHHLHGFYILLNSGINGLTQKELVLSAFIISNHRIGKLKNNLQQYNNILSKEDIDTIYKLSILLQIAESLDRSKIGKIQTLNCILKENTVTILVSSLYNIELEINKTMQVSGLFKKYFRKSLEIKA